MLRSRIRGAWAICVLTSCLASCTEDRPATNTSVIAPDAGGEGGMGGMGGQMEMGGAGGNSPASYCAGAKTIGFGDYLEGDLAVTGQEDLYRFQGTKGQVLGIGIDAQYLAGVSYDPTYIDPVLTLFDATGKPVAQNDNILGFGTLDSRIDTILPADGEYCILVSECWTTMINPSANCDGVKDKFGTKYALALYEYVDQLADGETAEYEPNDLATSANSLEYESFGDGDYYAEFWGTFGNEGDMDIFRFTVPSSYVVPLNSRAVGRFYFLPGGPFGSGSTAKMGRVWLADANNPDQILALGDASRHSRFAPRIDVDKPYLLFVERPPGPSKTNDFYFVRHYPWPSGTIEIEPAMGDNDSVDKAEMVTIDGQTYDGSFEGDLLKAPADVDHYRVDVPMGMNTVTAYCRALVDGSGLRDLKLSLLAPDGTLLSSSAWDTENTSLAVVADEPVGSNTQLIVRVEAGYQEPTVQQAFYGCGVFFEDTSGKM